jgi:hypothetical protein
MSAPVDAFMGKCARAAYAVSRLQQSLSEL